eukprot:SAG31_NODE_6814_length_1880_cov_1.220663_2_plen_171_part_00
MYPPDTVPSRPRHHAGSHADRWSQTTECDLWVAHGCPMAAPSTASLLASALALLAASVASAALRADDLRLARRAAGVIEQPERLHERTAGPPGLSALDFGVVGDGPRQSLCSAAHNRWTATSANGSITVAATIPGQIHFDLERAGVINNTYALSNQDANAWVRADSWSFD